MGIIKGLTVFVIKSCRKITPYFKNAFLFRKTGQKSLFKMLIFCYFYNGFKEESIVYIKCLQANLIKACIVFRGLTSQTIIGIVYENYDYFQITKICLSVL